MDAAVEGAQRAAGDSVAQTRLHIALRGMRLASLALVLLLYAFEFGAWKPQFDDAYISYRYAQNLIDGQGLVFNPGERVEGITNLFWTLLVAAGMALGFAAPVVGHALGFASGAALLALSACFVPARESRSAALVGALAPWLVLSSSPFAYWVISGMETPLYAALALGALSAARRGALGWATLMAFLATGTRPDAGLVAVAIYAVHVAEHWRCERWTCLRWPLVFAAALLLLTLFRIGYYGAPVPNTFQAKVGGLGLRRGIWYSLAFLLGGVWLLLPASFAAMRSDPRWRAAALHGALLVVYVIAVAGDVFPFGRFYLPLVPLLAVGAAQGVVVLYRMQAGLGALFGVGLAYVLHCDFFARHPLQPAEALYVTSVLGWCVVACDYWQRNGRRRTLLRYCVVSGAWFLALGHLLFSEAYFANAYYRALNTLEMVSMLAGIAALFVGWHAVTARELRDRDVVLLLALLALWCIGAQAVQSTPVRVTLLLALVAPVGAAPARGSRLRGVGAPSVASALVLLVALICATRTLPDTRRLKASLGGAPGIYTREETLARGYRYNESMEQLAKRRADLLAERGESGAWVATGGIGAFGFYSRAPIVDLFGLVDPVIARSDRSERVARPQSGDGDFMGWLRARVPVQAGPGHLRSNAEYVLAREPAYILIPERGTKMLAPPSLMDLWDHPDLERRYAWDPDMIGYRRRADASNPLSR